MKDKLVLITGANRGIGFHITRQLALMDARIVMACRDLSKAVPVCKSLRVEAGNSQIEVMRIDLASFESIRTFAKDFCERFSHLDVLINNAGVFSMKREETVDGFEKTIGTNYLGPFLLTNLLRPILENTSGARIINLSSNSHYFARLDLENLQFKHGYHGFLAYAASKLAIVLFTQELAERVRSSGIAAVSAHPGHVATQMWEIWTNKKWLQSILERLLQHIMISPREGAEHIVCLLKIGDLFASTGKYFSNGKLKRASRLSRDIELQRELWRLSERLTGIDG
jgi:NAD(P)-dependent dehydrogenase (short-subunit alcohol dehydrogenase family)